MSITPRGKNDLVHSFDAIFGNEIEAQSCSPFSEKVPLVNESKRYQKSLKSLKKRCRLGIPPHLRCAVWISSVVRIGNPSQPIEISDSYGTLEKRPSLNVGWDLVLMTVFPNLSDVDHAVTPDFGLTHKVLHQLISNDYANWNSSNLDNRAVPNNGIKSLKSVLCAVQHVLGVEYCPLLPDIAMILLTHMPECYAYATIREMIKESSYYLPMSRQEFYSWCKSYEHFIMKLSRNHFHLLKRVGVLTPEGLDPLFKRFFTTIMKREDVLHFMDIFLLEGSKAVFRLALSFIKLIPKYKLKSLNLTNAESWWQEIRKITLHPAFNLKKHTSKMYPMFGTLLKKFPNRQVLKRPINNLETSSLENMPIDSVETPPRPLNFISLQGVILAKPIFIRSNLSKWLPNCLKLSKLHLIYSTEVHGRSLSTLYKRCGKAEYTVMLVEAIIGVSSKVIGMFASHAWVIRPLPYADGRCFLFRADPDPKCYNWRSKQSEQLDDVNEKALRETFMTGRNDFIAMGSNHIGTNGLRLDKDLTFGESYPTLGFGNEPLAGSGCETFDIGVVEVYSLMKDVDVDEMRGI